MNTSKIVTKPASEAAPETKPKNEFVFASLLPVLAFWTLAIFVTAALVKILDEQQSLDDKGWIAGVLLALALLALVDKKRAYLGFPLAFLLLAGVTGDAKLAAMGLASSVLRALLENAAMYAGII
jgi:hypothetical protein